MSKVMLCHDGIEVGLENDQGLWVVLEDRKDEVLGRFEIDPSELRATIAGNFSFQATDGLGSSVMIEGNDGSLKVRLEGQGFAPKNCRLDASDVKSAIDALDIGV